MVTPGTNPNDTNILLKYRLLDASSEDPSHPLYELIRGQKGPGWSSSRYCEYPQTITIQFIQPVNIKQINICIHEKNIPTQIRFFAYNPSNSDEIIKNYKNLPYNYAGFIKMDSNTRSNFKLREFRKIYIDITCLYLKLELGKNYINRYNIFNQVGLISLEFYGKATPLSKNNKQRIQFYINDSVRPENVTDEELQGICGDKINQLKAQMEENIKLEQYDECKVIKAKLERVKMLGKKIYDLEYQKKIAVNNEDFDTAKELKGMVEKMKLNLDNVEKMYSNGSTAVLTDPTSIEEQIVGPNVHNNNFNINENPAENSLNNVSNLNNTSIADSRYNDKLNTSKHQKLNEDDFLTYDEIIIPTVLKKINNETPDVIAESGEAEKGELEPLDAKTMNTYLPFIKFIGEEGLRKLFSKQILWKEEGFDLFIAKMPDMFNSKDSSSDVNNLITLVMKLVMIFLEEKHPSTVIKTLDIVKLLLDSIKQHRTQLNIDLNITDSMLTKIKSKLGDVMPKVRTKTVELYCYMLTLDFCDYNNLISELIEEELKHIDSKYIPKSSKLILGKLEIFNKAFDDFQNAVQTKRTDMETFPYNLVSNYLILNVSHSKSEVRKMTRLVIGKFIKIFGTKNIQKKLERVDMRELAKLVNEIPQLKDVFPNVANANIGNTSLDMSMNAGNGNNANTVQNKKNNRSKSKGRVNTKGKSPKKN